jgi:hypothetical protein
MRSYGPKGRPPKTVHLPVGGRRFRSSIEDLIGFLVTEQLATGRPGRKEQVDQRQQRLEGRQFRAAVRRNRDIALAILPGGRLHDALTSKTCRRARRAIRGTAA